MSKRNFINIISIFLLLNLITITKQDSQIKIYSYSQDNTFVDPFDDDTELNTTDKNCNMTEYPEQARKCNNKTMVCKDENYLHHCSCKEGYITYVNDTNNITYCNFRQKKQLIAFLLELCVGFGAGHFYRNEFTMASLKLVGFALGLLFICTFPITAKCIADCGCEALAIILSIFYYLYLCGLAVWYIFDLVYFGNNYYEDYSYVSQYGKTFPLKPC